jgi:hypothetical protein
MVTTPSDNGLKVVTTAVQMAQLFTPEVLLTYEASELWHDNVFPDAGFSAFEAFVNDIAAHLVVWAVEAGDAAVIYYRTGTCWYIAERRAVRGADLVFLTRFELGTTRHWTTWCNAPSYCVGATWLREPAQAAKRGRFVAGPEYNTGAPAHR